MRRSDTFVHRFQASPATVFAAMGDTARYNEAAGFPVHAIEDVTLEDGSRRFVGRAKVGPFRLVWQDHPCNWVRGKWFEHDRAFSEGPLERITATLRLEADGAGCVGRYTLAAEASSPLGKVALATGFMPKAKQTFLRLARDADSWARGERISMFEVPPPQLAPGAAPRIERLAASLRERHAASLVERLVRHVATGPENDVVRLRPLALARAWGVEWRPVVELFLDATRQGLLALRWDLLCPRCRAAKSVSPSLDALPEGAHCSTCAIDYGRDFARNVELAFRPAEILRPPVLGEFCLLGPMSTPHVLAHVTVAAGATRAIEVGAEPGPLRVRTLEPGPELAIEHDGGALGAYTLTADAITGSRATNGDLVLTNATGAARTFVVEERTWVQDALTADRATSLQGFRDLFSDQILRPGDEVGIERIALLFTDIRGSTALYDRIGDAAAYRRVRDHFAALAAVVREHDGAVVKTIGDAVMAAFADPARAVQAGLAMQERVDPSLVLKIGVHEGPCIAVTLNERLDYFGGTVNMAARLQGESRGGDLVLSEATAADPGVREVLAGRLLEQGQTTLRGFAAPVAFRRVVLRSPD